jgi:nitrogen fixation-related uncharacterized protein
MPFFNFDAPATNEIVSHQFWIYWAATLPVTIIVIILWTIWYIWTVKNRQPEDEKESVDHSVFGRINLAEEAMRGAESSRRLGRNRNFVDGKWVIVEPLVSHQGGYRSGPPPPSTWKTIKERVFRRRYSISAAKYFV